MNTLIAKQVNNKVEIHTPYDASFISDLKDQIEWQNRTFDRTEKCWVVDQEFGDVAVAIAKAYWPQFTDGRQLDDDMAAIASHDSEMAYIKAMQSAILEAKESIEEKIKDLDAFVATFSYRSKSSRKWAAMTESARLSYALDYASQDAIELNDQAIATLRKVCDELSLELEVA